MLRTLSLLLIGSVCCFQDGIGFCGVGAMGAGGGGAVEPPLIVGGGEPLPLRTKDGGSPTVPVVRSSSPIRKRIYEALNRPLDFHDGSDLFTEWNDSRLTLEELIESISRIHKITVYADLQELKPEDIQIEVPPIYGEARPSLGTMLSSLLRYRSAASSPLAFMIEDDGLVITFLDIVVKRGDELAIYDISSLPEMDEDQLHEALTDLSGVSWGESDEDGKFDIHRKNRLLVRHKWFAHQKVHELLNSLATARSQTVGKNDGTEVTNQPGN